MGAEGPVASAAVHASIPQPSTIIQNPRAPARFPTMLGTPEIILIALVVLLVFGGKKIPELMKGLGKGVKSFKDGMNGLDLDGDSQSSASNTNDKGEGTTKA